MSFLTKLKETFGYPPPTLPEKLEVKFPILSGTSRCVDLGETGPGDFGNAIKLTQNFLGQPEVIKLFCGKDSHSEPFIHVNQAQGFKAVPVDKYLEEHPDARDGLLVFGVDLPGYRHTGPRYLYHRLPDRNRCRVWEQKPTYEGAMYHALVTAGYQNIANEHLPGGRARLLGILSMPRDAYMEYGNVGIAFLSYLMTGDPKIYNRVIEDPYMQKIKKFVCGPQIEVNDKWVKLWESAAPTE